MKKSDKQKRDRYEMHKYWGKKPSGGVVALIERYTNEGDTVLDPFSGYGVFSCEAYLINRNIIANDLNPIAAFLNKQLLESEINLDTLQIQWERIKRDFIPFVQQWYSLKDGDVNYQLVSVLRNKDDVPIKARVKVEGERGTKEIVFDKHYVENYLSFEKKWSIKDWYPKNRLIINSRISAKKDMLVSDLFTRRTLACHAKLLSLIEKYSSGTEKDLLKVAFTANLANCSKLVPPIKSRGELSQGAWMTGFYTGSTYIENNVYLYFENRFKKVLKGKEDYLSELKIAQKNRQSKNKQYNQAGYTILQEDAKNLSLKDESVDFIFTDPPYGGAVPYFEQSIVWNAWLKFSPDFANEIVVSDSKERTKSTIAFQSDINKAFKEIRRVLKMGKLFSFTYHSLSGFEWRAITNACLTNGFELEDYQWLVQKSFTPRQINRSTSIKGDVLVTLKKVKLKNHIKKYSDEEIEDIFINSIREWLKEQPLDTNEIFLKIMKKIFSEKILMNSVDFVSLLRRNFAIKEGNLWTNR